MLEHNVVRRIRRALGAARAAARALDEATAASPPAAALALEGIARCHRRQAAELSHVLAQTRARADGHDKVADTLRLAIFRARMLAGTKPAEAARALELAAIRACERAVWAACPSFVAAVISAHRDEDLDHMVRLAAIASRA